jgi:hypothetical protein
MPSHLARPHGSSTSPPSSLARLSSGAWLGRFGCDQIWGVKAQQQIGVDSCLGAEYTANAIEPAVRARRMPVWPSSDSHEAQLSCAPRLAGVRAFNVQRHRRYAPQRAHAFPGRR